MSAEERRTPEEVRAIVATVVDAVAPETALGGEHAPVRSAERRPSAADVAVGADHGGFHLKERIVSELRDHGFRVQDCGTEGPDSVDYPDYAHEVARLVATGASRWGIVVDGAGIGSAIAANKVPGVRAATCWDLSSARNSREHNHANVLALGAGLVGEALALQIVQAWLSTGWGGGRHARRVSLIEKIERSYTRATA